MPDREQLVLTRLEDQISWYNRRSNKNQRCYKWLKIASMSATGLVPVLAGFGCPASVGGVFGFAAFVFEGVQQLNQFHANWISYRSTCEALKHEKHLFSAQAGHYRDLQDPVTLLAEKIEGLVSVEHAKWVTDRSEPDRPVRE